MIRSFKIYEDSLQTLPNDQKLLINTINAHSYNVAQTDKKFRQSLDNCDVLIPDGVGVTKAIRFIHHRKVKKIAGADLFFYELNRLNQTGGKCFFLGSNEHVLGNIRECASIDFPNVEIATYSPPYKEEFTPEENEAMIEAINAFKPDVLFVGMTAPRQEKWAYENFQNIHAGHIGCIGAVFDFYAKTVRRAPHFMISLHLEWFYRLVKEPGRMWRRYILGNAIFILYIHKEKIQAYREYRKKNNLNKASSKTLY